MFRPNTECTVREHNGLDGYGQRQYGPEITNVPCTVSKWRFFVDQTSVRADSAASRGNAEEIIGDAILAMERKVKIDDIIRVYDMDTRVTSPPIPMPNRNGCESFYEVRVSAWNSDIA